MIQPENYKELQEHYAVFAMLGNLPDLPINRILAITMNKVHNEMKPTTEKVESLIEEYCVTDAAGKRLGIEYEVPSGVEGEPAKKLRRNVATENIRYEWLEIKEGMKAEFDGKLKALLETKTDLKYVPLKATNKDVRIIVPRAFKEGDTEVVHNVEITVPMMEVLEKKLPAQTLAFVLNTLVQYDGDF